MTKTREEIVAEYQQYGPTALKNLEEILQSDIQTFQESAKEAPAPEWADYWRGMREDAQTELSVCQERLAQTSA